MSSSADIRDIHYLELLQGSIFHFCGDMDNRFISIKHKLEERVLDIENKRNYFESLVEKTGSQLRYSEQKLQECESSVYTDKEGNVHYPNCSHEREEVGRFEMALRVAEDYLYSYEGLIKKLNASIDEYYNKERAFKTLNEFLRGNATYSLRQLINGLEDYISLSVNESGKTTNNFSEKISDSILFTSSGAGLATIFQSLVLFVGDSGKKFSLLNRINNNLISSFFENEV